MTVSRTVRVFLSSTFRDFAEERDLLVRKVFPELRRQCRARQVELVDVDLRWGITEEEAQQGRVLPICLAEIDRSRPFFMGFIGERYGWVPEAEKYDLSLIMEQPWLDEHRGGKSVTELEMLHGVLNNPAMEDRAFFYFRDAAYSNSKGGAYLSESEEDKAKLEALKDRIRKSGYPVVENYPSPEALAERVKEDLWRLIDEAFPENEVPDALVQERMRHEQFATSRLGLYLGGEGYFAALDAAMSAEPCRPVLVTGASGGGKSALLANWSSRWIAQNPNSISFFHYLGVGSDAADFTNLSRRLLAEIAHETGEEFDWNTDPAKILKMLPEWIARAGVHAERNGKTWLLVWDAIDKIPNPQDLRWLPRFLPCGVKLVVSALDCEGARFIQNHLGMQEIFVQSLGAPQKRDLIEKHLIKYRKSLSPSRVERVVAHSLSGNPLFLVTLLEELRVFGVHEELDRRLDFYLSADSMDDLFECVLERVEADVSRDKVGAALEAIWASRSGLFEDELLSISGLTPAAWATIRAALDLGFMQGAGRIQFAHDHFRSAIKDRYIFDDEQRQRVHGKLAEWFATRRVDERTAEELPWQWRKAGDVAQLKATLSRRELFQQMCLRSEYELLSYWQELGVDLEVELKNLWSDWKSQWQPASVDEFFDPVAKHLAAFLSTAGVYGAFTESLYRGILVSVESRFGADHVEAYKCLNSLATLLYNQGNFAAAESAYRRVLQACKRHLGLLHKDTLMSLNNLGVMLSDQGAYAEAQEILKQALDGWIQLRGEDDVRTLMGRGNLGRLYSDSGDRDAAEMQYQAALSGFEKILGPDHPHALMSVNNLGALYSQKKDHARAEGLYRRALAGYAKILGEDHPHTLMSVNNLANTLSDTNRPTEAQLCYEKALEGYCRTLGEGHPYTLISFQNLGNLKRANGKFDHAESHYRQALLGWEKVYSPDHPYTLGAVSALGSLLNQTGRSAEAASLLAKYSEISSNAMAYLRYNLACYECLCGNLERAKKLVAEEIAANESPVESKNSMLEDEDLAQLHDFLKSTPF